MHKVGDRVSYYQDDALTGVVARVKPVDNLHPVRVVYGVYWDNEPERFAHWYTYSMLTSLEEE